MNDLTRCLICIYDEVGKMPVSFQTYNCLADFFRSLIESFKQVDIPFVKYPKDYSIRILGFYNDSTCIPSDIPYVSVSDFLEYYEESLSDGVADISLIIRKIKKEI